MKTASSLSNYLRITLVSLFIALLGLAPYPHTATSLLQDASRAIANGDLLIASQNLASVSEYFPWRYTLNLTAGKLALQAGAPEAHIQYLERPGTISHLSIDDLILLGDAYLQSGDSIMAEAIWMHVSELEASNPADKRLVNLYIQRKDYSSAVLVLEVLLRNNPSDIDLYYQVGSLNAITDPVKALPFLAQSEEIDSVDSDHAHTLHDKIRTARLYQEPSYTLLIAGRQLAD